MLGVSYLACDVTVRSSSLDVSQHPTRPIQSTNPQKHQHAGVKNACMVACLEQPHTSTLSCRCGAAIGLAAQRCLLEAVLALDYPENGA